MQTSTHTSTEFLEVFFNIPDDQDTAIGPILEGLKLHEALADRRKTFGLRVIAFHHLSSVAYNMGGFRSSGRGGITWAIKS
jgi:hypothetical protein